MAHCCNASRCVCTNPYPRDRVPLIREFLVFLKKFGVLALAVGVLLGEQVNNLEKALIDDVVMPLLDPLLPSGSWESAVIMVGQSKLKIGHLLEATLHFTIVALTVFLLLRFFLRDVVDDEAPTK